MSSPPKVFKRYLQIIARNKLITKKRTATSPHPSIPYPALTLLVQSYGTTEKAPELLYLGDSVVERVSREDTDKRTLGEMTRDRLQSLLDTVLITHSAYHPRIYYHLCTVLQDLPRRPKILLLPVNMRCFSPQWDLNPEWQFDREIKIIKAYRAAPEDGIAQLEDYRPASEEFEIFDATSVDFSLSSFNTVGQFRLLIQANPATEVQRRFRLQQIFIFHYLHKLDPGHPKLQYLRELLNLLLQMKIVPIVYVTPVNYEAGVRYIGSEFKFQIEENVDTLTQVLKPYIDARQILFWDYNTLFSSKYFFHEDLATEHLNQEGRRDLSDLLATHIRDAFREVFLC